MALGMWHYVAVLMMPYHLANSDLGAGRREAHGSDLYAPWRASRELLLRGRNPYGPAVTRHIQAGYYGRPLREGSAEEPPDPQRFVYPLYVLVFLAPSVGLPFAVVQLLAALSLALLLAGAVAAWMYVVASPPGRRELLLAVILVLGSFPVLYGLYLQQLSLLVAALQAGAGVAILRRNHALGGLLLAFSTIKPHLALLPVGVLLLWCSGRWRERYGLFWGFGAGMGALFAGAEIMLSGWFGHWLAAATAYAHYPSLEPMLVELLGKPGWILIPLLLVAVVLAGYRARLAPDLGALDILLVLSFALAASAMTAPKFAVFDQVILLPVVLTLWRRRTEVKARWPHSGVLLWPVAAALVWPWISAAALVVAAELFCARIDAFLLLLPFYTRLLFPASLLIMLIYVVFRRPVGSAAETSG